MAILSTLLTNTPTAISPSLSSDVAITVMMFCNLNAADPLDDTVGRQFIDVHVVASGGSPTTTNLISNQIPLDASDTFVYSTERLVLSPGDRIYASTTDLSEVTVTISYVII
jgi:hypothetical protein